MKLTLKKNPLPVILFTIFLDLLGIGILIPVIPLLLADPRSPFFLLPKGFSMDQGYLLLGVLTASYPFMQFLAAPILGQLSDKFGRKPILAISLVGTALSYLVFAFGIVSRNIPLLFISRAFDGITGGNLAVAQAAIADITSPIDRVKRFGLIGAVMGLGFIIGPYLGGKLSDPLVHASFNPATPFYFAAILSFVNVLLVIFILPETHKTMVKTLTINWGRSVHNVYKAFTAKGLQSLFLTNFFFQGGFSFFITFFGVFLIQQFGFSQGQTGEFFAFVGICIAITQAFITRSMAKRFREQQILNVTLFTSGLLVLLYFFPKESWQLYILVPFFAVSNGLSQANLIGLISKSAGAEIQGEVLGVNASVQALAQSIPPVLAGIIAAKITPSTPLIAAFLVIMVSAIIFNFIYKPAKIIHQKG